MTIAGHDIARVAPDLYVLYFRDLRDMIAVGRTLIAEATVEAMSRYATKPASDFAWPRRLQSARPAQPDMPIGCRVPRKR